MTRRAALFGLAAAGAALLAACAKPRRRRVDAVVPRPGTQVRGIASWYGPGYHGKRTSSGERFDQDDLTAAHYNWAFGTRVRVTFLANGKSVIVRINDRLPRRDRIIDLSRGAARRIGLIGPGTGKVVLEVLA